LQAPRHLTLRQTTKPAKAVKKITVKKVEAASEKIPTVADDGQAHLVTWKGKSYYMMASGEAWIQNKDKSMGSGAGMFDETKNILDETLLRSLRLTRSNFITPRSLTRCEEE